MQIVKFLGWCVYASICLLSLLFSYLLLLEGIEEKIPLHLFSGMIFGLILFTNIIATIALIIQKSLTRGSIVTIFVTLFLILIGSGIIFVNHSRYAERKVRKYRVVRSTTAPKVENTDTSSTSTLPPILSIGDIEFSQKVLDASETATLSIPIKNVGSGDARNLSIQLSCDLEGLSFPHSTDIQEVIPKKTGEKTVNIQIEGTDNLPTGKAKMEIYLIEPHFKQRIPGKRLTFPTRKLRTPKLVLVHPTVVEKESARPNGEIDLNEVIELKFYVQNQGIGDAKEVKVQVNNSQEGVIRLRTNETESKTPNPIFYEIRSGKHQLISNIYTYHINSEFKDRELLFEIIVTDQHGDKYGFLEMEKFPINKKLKPLGEIKPVSIDTEAEFHEPPQVEELDPLKSSGNTRWIVLLILFCFGSFFLYLLIWKRLRRGKQTEPSDSDQRQKKLYEDAAGQKENIN